MFLIFGINDREKQLAFDQLIVCGRCGRYGHVTVFVRYTCFALSFIPLFRWNKRYVARMSCCGAETELDPVLGRSIERGETKSVDPAALHFTGGARRCPNCGFVTGEDYLFCPKCGKPLQ